MRTTTRTSPRAPRDGALRGVIEKQTKLGEPVRFTENLIETLSAARGEDGLWRLAGLWQSLLQNRLSAKESELSNDIQQLLRNYLKQQGQDMQAKVTVQFDALPADIRAEFTRLQQTYREESMAMVRSPDYLPVRAPGAVRLARRAPQRVRGHARGGEKRLQAKVALQSLFSGADAKTVLLISRRSRERGRSQQREGRHERGAQCRSLASSRAFARAAGDRSVSNKTVYVTRSCRREKNLRDVSTCQ